jgi:hypothetical protein
MLPKSETGGAEMSYIGINIGAITVKAVAVQGSAIHAAVAGHLGRPPGFVEKLASTPLDRDPQTVRELSLQAISSRASVRSSWKACRICMPPEASF